MPAMPIKKLAAEAAGTAMLVFFAVGVATLTFGFGAAGSSYSAGVVATALAFGLMLLVLAYALGPISGCHINPAVTMGFLAARRINLREACEYWVAQFAGGIVGALVLWGVVNSAKTYTDDMGLGANGFGNHSEVGINTVGALSLEVILTFLFVFTVLTATRKAASPLVAGVVIGLGLTVVHLIGIPFTGTSVNPARSLGPALFVGGYALSQLWVFIVAPLAGGALAAVASEYFYPSTDEAEAETVALPDAVPDQRATTAPHPPRPRRTKAQAGESAG
jgi:aquaporin Z